MVSLSQVSDRCPFELLVCVWSLFCGVVLGFLSSFTIISLWRRGLNALLWLLAAMWRLVYCVSSSWCCGLVCSVWLWHFLVIHTFWKVFACTVFNRGDRGKMVLRQNDTARFFKRWCHIWRFLLKLNAHFEIRHIIRKTQPKQQS